MFLEEFNLNDMEAFHLGMIAGRASKIAKARDLIINPTQLTLDVATCHAYACPLKLKELAEADDDALMLEVTSIQRHLYHPERMLDDSYMPRFADLDQPQPPPRT